MSKIALYGGTFDPIHMGHAACLQHMVEQMNFSQVFIIPAGRNPLKTSLIPAPAQDRLDMIEVAINDFSEEIQVDESEVFQESPTYSYQTLQRYIEQYKPEDLYFVMGIDVFQEFDQWKNFSKILEMTNLLIVSRPPYVRPFGVEEFPEGVQQYINSYDRGFALLHSGRHIEFVKIETEDISSRQIRKNLKTGKNVSSSLSMDVEKFIIEKSIYPRISPGIVDFKELTEFCGKDLNERAMNAAGYDLSDLEKLYDYTLIASATSTKQAQSLAANLKELVKEEYGLTPFSEEGNEDGRWVILDYGGLIVHIFYDYVRHEYHLEQLWADGKRIELKPPPSQ